MMREIRLPSPGLFGNVVHEVAQAKIPWTKHYSEYQSGGWWTCTLLGRTKDAGDGCVTDTIAPQVTDVLRELPAVHHLLQGLGLRYMMVRLAKLDAGGALWEHRDYQDLTRASRHRIHIPLATNMGACLVCGGSRFHMGLGSAWTFLPVSAHAACNAGEAPRIHLILDIYDDEAYNGFSADARDCVPLALPRISAAEIDKRVACIRRMPMGTNTSNGNLWSELAPWEEAVLRLYFELATPEGQLYIALGSACTQAGDLRRAAFWKVRGQKVLGNGIDA